MGRNKARLRVGGASLLSQVRTLASVTKHPVRVIRRDLVKRCGPLGGIVTACKTSKAQSILFLACDMPFVSRRLLGDLIGASGAIRAVFAVQNNRAGFPFIIPVAKLPRVEEQMGRGEFSLQRLASSLKACRVRVPSRSHELFNVNTPEDIVAAERLLRKTQKVSRRLQRPRRK